MALFEGFGNALGRLNGQVGVRDVGGVVDGEAETNDEEDCHDTIHGQVPVVHQTQQENVYEHDGEDDEDGDGQTAGDKEDHDQYGEQ